jgi:hypothetical protein
MYMPVSAQGSSSAEDTKGNKVVLKMRKRQGILITSILLKMDGVDDDISTLLTSLTHM